MPRMSIPTRFVLRALLAEGEIYGNDLSKRSGLENGTLAPLLRRLEAAGWVASRWEDGDPRALGRPRRRYYRLTDAGAEAAKGAKPLPRE